MGDIGDFWGFGGMSTIKVGVFGFCGDECEIVLFGDGDKPTIGYAFVCPTFGIGQGKVAIAWMFGDMFDNFAPLVSIGFVVEKFACVVGGYPVSKCLALISFLHDDGWDNDLGVKDICKGVPKAREVVKTVISVIEI